MPSNLKWQSRSDDGSTNAAACLVRWTHFRNSDCVDTVTSGQPLDVKPPRDKSALHSGMVDTKPKHCRPTVVKLFGGRVAVI